MLTPENARSYAVLSLVFAELGEHALRLVVTPYQRSMEIGFHLKWRQDTEFLSAVAENRKVLFVLEYGRVVRLYRGTFFDFDLTDGSPSSRVIESAQQYDRNDPLALAKHIADYMMGEGE